MSNLNTVYSNFIVESNEITNQLGQSIKNTQQVFKRLLDEKIIKTIGDLLDSDDEIYNDPVVISPPVLLVLDIRNSVQYL